MRAKLHELLRVARFQGWESERLEAAILQLLGLGEVDDQPATPDQPPEPSQPPVAAAPQ